MPNEALITQIENILSEIVDIGGRQEITSIVTNLEVVDASPSGLTGFITIKDERDGDTILAKKVPGVGYAATNLVNVLFVNGAEPVAFQQGSQSSGDPVLVSKLVSPDETIDPVISADNSGDVTIAEAGDLIVPDQIIHSGDTDTNIAFTTDDIEFTIGSLSMLKLTEAGQDLITLGPGSGDVDIDFNGDMFLRGSDGFLGIGTTSPDRLFNVEDTSRFPFRVSSTDAGALVGPIFEFFRDSASPATNDDIGELRFQGNDAGGNSTTYAELRGTIANPAEGSESGRLKLLTTINGDASNVRMLIDEDGDIKTSTDATTVPTAQFHIDQNSTTAAQPVLLLDQADISEEMIEFVSTIGVGNAIEAVAAKTLTVTHFIKVTLPGSLTRYLQVGTIA